MKYYAEQLYLATDECTLLKNKKKNQRAIIQYGYSFFQLLDNIPFGLSKGSVGQEAG